MSGLEAVGDAVTGAVVARAVEPAHGHYGETTNGACLNCGTQLVGAYCHACGQNSHIHRTLAGFGHDLLHGVFHFEGKIWTTLPMLVFKPGDLTRRYIAGERAKFVSPLAMYLFSVFLTFAVIGGLAGQMHAPEMNASDKAKSLAQMQKSLEKNEQEAARLKMEKQALQSQGKPTEAIDAKLDGLDKDNTALKVAREVLGDNQGAGSGTMLGFTTGWSFLDEGIKAANANPNLFLYRLQSSAYKYSWMLIPISTPMVWLLFFWKRQYKVYDHLVFVTFSLTFMLLLLTALTICGAVGLYTTFIMLVVMIVPPLHLYKQVRGAYASGRVAALVRTAMLLVFTMVALLIYFIALLVLGVMH